MNEFRHFLGQARGSLMEVETQIQIAQNLDYIQGQDADSIFASCAEGGRILNGLLSSIANSREEK